MTNPTILKGRNVLAVEDAMMIVMLLEDTLEEAGCNVTCAGGLEKALLLARERNFDAAILDVNLNGELSYPVADVLISRGIPFVFTTGYGNLGVDSGYSSRPVLTKPYQPDDLIAALVSLIAAPELTV